MAITSFDGFIAAPKHMISIQKVAARTTVASVPFSLQDLNGSPGAVSSFAVGNTSTGLVPTDNTEGFPHIPFSTGELYIYSLSLLSATLGHMNLYDRLFHVGGISYAGATTTLSSQPSYSSRVTNGTDFSGTQIWIEVTTAFATGNNWSVVVTYTDQDGNPGASTGTMTALAAASLTKGKMLQLVLASGDTGVQKIESIIVTNGATAMTAGVFNVMVQRPLWQGPWTQASQTHFHPMSRTGMPIIYPTSALAMYVITDGAVSTIDFHTFISLAQG